MSMKINPNELPPWFTKIRVGDELTEIRQNGQMAMDSRNPSKPQRFMVTSIDESGISLKPV